MLIRPSYLKPEREVIIQNRLTFLCSEVLAMTCSAYFIYLTGRTVSANNKEGNEDKRQKTQSHRLLYQITSAFFVPTDDYTLPVNK